MREIARKGKTVITIVHQPSTDIFTHFDRIYLLASGREVYQVVSYSIIGNH
jgi:ABC-type multidrug transport system ATPase subunit